MESLEKLIEKRMNQSNHMAMMIPRYLENPNAFLGSKNFTLEQAALFKADAQKCKSVLDFLTLDKRIGKRKLVHPISGNIGTFVKEFQNHFGDAIMIKLANGREYFAPKREFIEIV